MFKYTSILVYLSMKFTNQEKNGGRTTGKSGLVFLIENSSSYTRGMFFSSEQPGDIVSAISALNQENDS